MTFLLTSSVNTCAEIAAFEQFVFMRSVMTGPVMQVTPHSTMIKNIPKYNICSSKQVNHFSKQDYQLYSLTIIFVPMVALYY